jgi:ACT domain-containing protein
MKVSDTPEETERIRIEIFELYLQGGFTMRAVISVIGKDRVGIIAGVTKILAEANVNILDISQTIMQEIFTMVMLVDISQARVPFTGLSEALKDLGVDMGLSIQIQHEDIFNSMHRI